MRRPFGSSWEAAVHAAYPANDPSKRVVTDAERDSANRALALYCPDGAINWLAKFVVRGLNYEPNWYQKARDAGQAAFEQVEQSVDSYNQTHANARQLMVKTDGGELYNVRRIHANHYDVDLVLEKGPVAIADLPPSQLIAHSQNIGRSLEAQTAIVLADQTFGQQIA